MQKLQDEQTYIAHMQAAFDALRQASHSASAPPSASWRKDRLRALKEAIISTQDAIVTALMQDFGFRAHAESRITDILPAVSNINYCIHHLAGWMKPSKRKAGMALFPAKVRVEYKPLGVVGIIVPWNYPLVLSVGPLAYAIAAGNRAMLKMSPWTPAFNQVFGEIIERVFSTDEVVLYEGELDVSKAFAALPFDHMLFTGSTRTGREVMRAAADNLTPVTLELGGKSPVIIDDDIPISLAVERMAWGKTVNAGQTCIAPDYVLVPTGRVSEFVGEYRRRYAAMYPGGAEQCSVVNDIHFKGILNLLDDARDKGAEIISAGIDGAHERALATRLVINTTAHMTLMQQEIFGPVLPIVPYDGIDEAIDFVHSLDRPLALYMMSHDSALVRRVLDATISGGAAINDTTMQFVADDAPFGGVGPSGMGSYHGKEGFLTFSHARTIVEGRKLFNTGKLVHPPYGGLISRFLLKYFLR